MQIRVTKRVSNSVTTVFISTFHRFGLNVLRNYGYLIGLDENFEIADQNDKYRIIREVVGHELGKENLLEISQEISRGKNGRPIATEKEAKILKSYDLKLKEKNLIDFDDLICLSVLLFERFPELALKFQKRFTHVLIDEYQDINLMQEKLISLLICERSNIFVVGDDDQCIYEWRGSAPTFLSVFASHPLTQVFKLEENFRSDGEIVNMSDKLIKRNNRRIKKKIRCSKRGRKLLFQDKTVEVRPFYSEEDEAKFITNKIKQLVHEYSYSYSDFAILIRRKKQVASIKNCFVNANIPCNDSTGDGEQGLANLIRVLLAIDNFKNEKAWLHAINYPVRVLGNVAYRQLAIENGWQDLNPSQILCNLATTDVDFPGKAFFSARYAMLCDLHRQKDSLSVFDIVGQLLSFYNDEGLKAGEEREIEIKRLSMVQDFASDFSAMRGNGHFSRIREFVDALQCTQQSEDEPAIKNDCVNILTCHKAKGLEFPIVFIPGVQIGNFPNPYFVNSAAELEQERRLFYVTITRAIDRLFITSSADPLDNANGNAFVKNGFFAEIL